MQVARTMYPQRAAQVRKTETVGKKASFTNRAATESFHPLLYLQRTVGNQVVQRLLRSRTIQAKLSISHPNDIYEQEADRIAEQVMRMPEPAIQRACAPCASDGAPYPKCEAENEQLVQRKVEQVSDAGSSVPDDFLRDLGPGQPLDPATRAYFEPRFGYDFSGVRVHADNRGAESARAVNALAYTAGREIVFGAGSYAPQTPAGRHLVAHELVHIVQQGNDLTSSPARLLRKVGSVRCPPNVFGTPEDPRAALENLDSIAIDLANQAADGLAADAEEVAGGMPDSPSLTLQSYQDHFGLPNAVGRGFLNRLTGLVRPSQEIAASEELRILSRRFRLAARLFGQTVNYRCPGNAVFTIAGCGSGSCGTGKALACRGQPIVILCRGFWEDIETGEARASVLIHEAMHIIFGTTAAREQGEIGDETQRGPGRNFNVAGCYELIVEDIAGVESPPPFPCPPVP